MVLFRTVSFKTYYNKEKESVKERKRSKREVERKNKKIEKKC